MTSKYPEIFVQLSGEDGNAFVIIARVRKALREAGHRDKIEEFTKEAQSGNYDHVLLTCMKWVETG